MAVDTSRFKGRFDKKISEVSAILNDLKKWTFSIPILFALKGHFQKMKHPNLKHYQG